MARRHVSWGVALVAWLAVMAIATPAWACGGLVAPNGSVRLLRTATLAAYHDGLEHYVTSFTFGGDGQEVGSIVPLPGVPTKVERGGDWTLQRLDREIHPPVLFAAARASAGAAASADAQELYRTKIDALDIVILKGGGDEVGRWAAKHGYLLTPDAPAVLDFYAKRSPIFMAARFDAAAARQRNQESGDGTPIHLTIPTTNPWVPLRILTLGRGDREPVDAEVYLLTDQKPALLPWTLPNMKQESSGAASEALLNDLRADKTMGWVPGHAWLMAFHVEGESRKLHYDLAIDASGRGRPSWVATGLVDKKPVTTTTAAPTTTTAQTNTTTTLRELALQARRTGSSSPLPALVGLVLLVALVAGLGTLRFRRLRRP